MTSGYAIATLVVFIISIFFVICPVTILTPRPIPRIPLNLTTTPILAIALLWAAQCLDPAVIRNGIVGTEGIKPYNVLILFFSLAYMAITLDVTGIFQAAAYWVKNKGGHNGWKLYLYFYILLTLVSILLGNDPAILFGTAFMAYYTKAAELDPMAWVMAELAAANTASMVLFVGNPTNVVICEGFSINNTTFTAYTILPFVACNIFCFATLAFQYRKKVPRTLTHTADQDPMAALLDPVGAIVGSILLGTTLILCLVTSFFGIDAWMITLPFAVAKFLFDLGWDHYRHARGIPMLGRIANEAVVKGSDAKFAVGESLYTGTCVSRTSLRKDAGRTTSLHHSTHLSPSRKPLPLPILDQIDSHSSGSGELPLVAKVYAMFLCVCRWCRRYMVDLPMTTVYTMFLCVSRWYRSHVENFFRQFDSHFPTFTTALPRLPFALVPFAFSQFILVEALDHQGWVDVFSAWFVRASDKEMYPTIWLVGVLGVILCSVSGTNIGATILLTKIIRAAALPYAANHGAAIALAVASNIGAVGITFSASLAGLLWRAILGQKGIAVRQRDFALWNLFPLIVMTSVGLGVVSVEMAVLFSP